MNLHFFHHAKELQSRDPSVPNFWSRVMPSFRFFFCSFFLCQPRSRKNTFLIGSWNLEDTEVTQKYFDPVANRLGQTLNLNHLNPPFKGTER